RDSGHVVLRTNNRLEPGEYDVYCDSPINVNDEPWVQRLISFNVSGREDAFKIGIRARDGRCVISGVVNRAAYRGEWTRFEAAHIFPLEKENLWVERGSADGLRTWMIQTECRKINSLQNGMLIRRDIHNSFDQYLISVNPDVSVSLNNILIFILTESQDNYKIFDGRVLDPVCRDPNNPHSVSDELLRWHFRQSVLANMRGAGEPIFEHDFTGEDMIKVISGERYGNERLEMEVEARLRGFVKFQYYCYVLWPQTTDGRSIFQAGSDHWK
ncbi:HNH endonuclease-domain-containing protein, partial [Tirmania nivea]